MHIREHVLFGGKALPKASSAVEIILQELSSSLSGVQSQDFPETKAGGVPKHQLPVSTSHPFGHIEVAGVL